MGFFKRLFAKRQTADPTSTVPYAKGFFVLGGGEGAYFDFRKRKLALTSAERIKDRIPVTAEAPIWAVMMEFGCPEEYSWLLFALGDGDTILYTSNGGLTGGGDVSQFVAPFIQTANRCLEHLTPAKTFPVPAAGNCTFYAITDAGVLVGTGLQDDLGNDRHPLSPLYHAGHEVITQVRYRSSWRTWALSWLKRENATTEMREHTTVWGVLSELGTDAAVPAASIFASIDGIAGVYALEEGSFFEPKQLSQELRRANAQLIATAERLVQHLQPTEVFPFPSPGHVIFYVGTQTGILSGGAAVGDLESGSHPLSPLYDEREAVFRIASQYIGKERPEQADLEALYNRGIACAQQGELDQAVAVFSEVIRCKPDLAEAYGSRGFAYSQKDDLDRAIADFNEAIRLEPGLADAYKDRGRTYAKKGDSGRAIADCTEALRLRPQFAEAHHNRGLGYVIHGDLDRAIADFNEAIRLEPACAASYRNRGYAAAQQGDLDKAIADYDEAIRLEPGLAETYHIRGVAYEQKGQSEKAKADFRKAQELTRTEPSRTVGQSSGDRIGKKVCPHCGKDLNIYAVKCRFCKTEL